MPIKGSSPSGLLIIGVGVDLEKLQPAETRTVMKTIRKTLDIFFIKSPLWSSTLYSFYTTILSWEEKIEHQALILPRLRANRTVKLKAPNNRSVRIKLLLPVQTGFRSAVLLVD